jgi:hypothetical protein
MKYLISILILVSCAPKNNNSTNTNTQTSLEIEGIWSANLSNNFSYTIEFSHLNYISTLYWTYDFKTLYKTQGVGTYSASQDTLTIKFTQGACDNPITKDSEFKVFLSGNTMQLKDLSDNSSVTVTKATLINLSKFTVVDNQNCSEMKK